jgi:hypothetical protein
MKGYPELTPIAHWLVLPGFCQVGDVAGRA